MNRTGFMLPWGQRLSIGPRQNLDMQGPSACRSSAFREYLALALVFAVAIATRAWDAGAGYAGDEIYSVQLAGGSFRAMLAGALGDQPHPPLYYFLLYCWIHSFGSGEFQVRALSIVLTACVLPSAYCLFRRFTGATGSLTALAVLAFSPFFYYYTLEARPYVLVALFGSLNLNCFFVLRRHPDSPRWLVLWSLSCLGFLFSQYLAILVIATEVIFLAVRERRLLLRYCAVVMIPLCVAGGWFAASTTLHSRLLPEIAWMHRPGAMDLAWLYVASIGDDVGLRSTILLLLLCLPAVSLVWSRRSTWRLAGEEVFLLLIAFGIPLLVFVTSVFGPQPIFAARQLLIPAMCFVLLIAIAIETLPRALTLATATAIVLWSAVALGRQTPSAMFGPWRELAARIDRLAGTAPLFTVEDSTARYLDYYRRLGPAEPIRDPAVLHSTRTIFVACRPFKCTVLQDASLASRRSILGDWKWGPANGNQAKRELRLYRLAPGGKPPR